MVAIVSLQVPLRSFSREPKHIGTTIEGGQVHRRILSSNFVSLEWKITGKITKDKSQMIMENSGNGFDNMLMSFSRSPPPPPIFGLGMDIDLT